MALEGVYGFFGWVGAVVVWWCELEGNGVELKESIETSCDFFGDLEDWFHACLEENGVDFVVDVKELWF